MTHDRVIAGGFLVTPQGTSTGHIGITGGRIAAVSPDPLHGYEVIDARHQVVLPGAVDLHVHFNEPGRTDWEGWSAGSRAAAAGGVTTVVEMPLNAIPPTTTVAALDAKVAAAQSSSIVDFALWGGLVTDNLEHLAALAERGVIGFKAFMCPSGTAEFAHVEDGVLYEGLCRIAGLGSFLSVHAESHWITRYHTERLQASGRHDRQAWAASRPPVAELEAIQRAVFLAQRAECPLHIVHMSLPEGTALIHAAKDAGQAVTVETCAHYLTLTDDDFVRVGPTLVPLLLTEGVHRRAMPLEQFAVLLAAAPARIAGLWPRKGAIQTGADADLVIVEMEREWTVDLARMYYRHRHSPFAGRRMKGWITHVLRRGEILAADGEVVAERGGMWLVPAPESAP